MEDVSDLAKAVTISSILFFFLEGVVLGVRTFPFSIYFFEAILFFLLFAGTRATTLAILQRHAVGSLGDPSRVIIVGAGVGAVLLLQAMKQTKYTAVGLVDDDPTKQKLRLDGVSVVATK